VSSKSPSFGPVATEDRLVLVDVLRGFALLGIAFVNMSWFALPNGNEAFEPRLFQETYNRAAGFLVMLLFGGKANSIFSFLFGLGLTIQMQRAEGSGQLISSMYLRRMFVLFVIGMLHSVFLWHGDVLHDYAVIGLILLAVRNASNRWIFGLAALGFTLPLIRAAVSLVLQEPATIPVAQIVARAHEDMRVFQSGTYWEQIGARLYQMRIMHIVNVWNAQGEPIFALQLMTTVLFGLYAGREKLFTNVEKNLDRIRKWTAWTLIVGSVCALGVGAFYLVAKPEDTVSFKEIMLSVLYNLNRPLLCIGYIGGIVLLWQRPNFRKLLRIFAPAGTMPLTNYIMQSVLATFIFYSYGLGYFGRIGPMGQAAISLAIFALQAIASSYWVEHFQYGPLEWLWRYASYGKRPAFLRVKPRPVAVGNTSENTP